MEISTELLREMCRIALKSATEAINDVVDNQMVPDFLKVVGEEKIEKSELKVVALDLIKVVCDTLMQEAIIATYKLPMRVEVSSGDKSQDLGLGTYTEDVTVWFKLNRDGSILLSAQDAETKPNDEDDWLQHDKIPKIILDSGETVYGCQVWWAPLKEKEDEFGETP